MSPSTKELQYGDPEWGDPRQVAIWNAARAAGHDLADILRDAQLKADFFPELALEKAARYLAGQERGSHFAHADYLRGMDTTEKQKVALCSAYLPSKGVIVDMGSGSGRSTYSLASLYPGVFAVGVDITQDSIEHAKEHYQRDNLAYVLGDITQRIFPPASVDGILNISVIHHVTSFNNFDITHVERLLDNQAIQLKTGGRLVIRDFVIADWPEVVQLSVTDLDGNSDPRAPTSELSSAAAFLRFASDFRSSQHPTSAVPRIALPNKRPGFRSFELLKRDAQEFALHKDYRLSWDAECREEYLFWTQGQYLDALRQRDLRVIYAVKITNPWIVKNRFTDKIFLTDRKGRALEMPPTNFIIIGEKVASGGGVLLQEKSHESGVEFTFCKLESFRNRETGERFEMVNRPNQTVQLVLWRRESDGIKLIAKDGFPRPLINANSSSPNLDGSFRSGYVTEPVTQIVDESHTLSSAIEAILTHRIQVENSRLVGTSRKYEVLTSPGGIDERLTIVTQEIDGPEVESAPETNYSGLSTSGTIKELDAQQLLRTCQVGGIVDNRLERAAYEILLQLGVKFDPWIGETFDLGEQLQAKIFVNAATALLQKPPRRIFDPVPNANPTEFLDLRKGEFVELNSSGDAIATRTQEYVTPRRYSDNTVCALPVVRIGSKLFFGLEERDLPAAQSQYQDSRLITAPAFRLERSIELPKQMLAALQEKMKQHFKVDCSQITTLGGKYYSSIGVTGEVVYPYLIEVSNPEDSTLHWVEAKDLLNHREFIKDGHLATALLRAMHLLGEI